MGRYCWTQIALLALSVGWLQPSHAVVRQQVKPTAESVIKGSASTGAISTPYGEVAFFGQEKVYEMTAGNRFGAGDVVKPTVRPLPASTVGSISTPYGENAYFGTPNPTATKVKVKPVVKVPKTRIVTKLKNIVKTNPTQIALQGAIAAAIAGVDWVMTEGSVIKKKEKAADPVNTTYYHWKDQYQNVPAASPLAAAQGFLSRTGGGSVCSTLTATADNVTYSMIRPGDQCASTGYTISVYRAGNGCASGSTYDTTQKACMKEQLVPITDGDLSKLDPWTNAQTAPWLSDLVKEMCNGSPNPAACFGEMKDSQYLEGPATVPGGSSLTSSTFSKPDGSTGTKTIERKTDFGISYGPDYFDVTPKTTETTKVDGNVTETQTSEDTTPLEGEGTEDSPSEEEDQEPEYSFEDSELPEVEPFYEQKYPDGLQGVWDQASASLSNSAFIGFLRSFVPSFSGTCPGFQMPLNIESWASYGTQNIPMVCYGLDFVKAFILLGAMFLCRSLIFGG